MGIIQKIVLKHVTDAIINLKVATKLNKNDDVAEEIKLAIASLSTAKLHLDHHT